MDSISSLRRVCASAMGTGVNGRTEPQKRPLVGRKSEAKYMKTSNINSSDEQGQCAVQEPESQDKCRKWVRSRGCEYFLFPRALVAVGDLSGSSALGEEVCMNAEGCVGVSRAARGPE